MTAEQMETIEVPVHDEFVSEKGWSPLYFC
jgi:hypothetical protein